MPTVQLSGSTVVFANEEILANPTPTTISLRVQPAEDVSVFVSYGRTPGQHVLSTATQDLTAQQHGTFTLRNLAPDGEFYYRLHCRRPSEAVFAARPEKSFRTLRREPEATFSFALASDSHIFTTWLRSICGSSTLENFQKTKDNILSADVDFLILGGDNFITHTGVPGCAPVAEYGSGTVRTQRHADLRYQKVLSPELWGGVAGDLPLFYVLGNHDGETQFGNTIGSCGHFDDTGTLSRSARLKYLPDPTESYYGSPDHADYFTFASGAARFIILDVMIGPDEYPDTDTWTLGATQLLWLENVLERSTEQWKFVFIEHLVGGEDGPLGSCVAPGIGGYSYARGGLRSTLDNEITGEFKGEQAYLQQLMRENGVNLFFHAHDHVAIAGEKKSANGQGEGVYYVMGGQCSNDHPNGPGWASDSGYQAEMDYDSDGTADYLSGVNGSLVTGYFLVSVEGSAAVQVEYIESNAFVPQLNGRTVFGFTLFPDGTSTLHF
ncbi:MAG: 3',5'-cyclic AMP phosphodiesterase CpdA [Planctomycetota bacterium]|jgi:3',5'-cyclic AMP phosphodiesterase CpdA